MTDQTSTPRKPRRMAREAKVNALTASPITRPRSKAWLVEDLLLRDDGASLDNLCQATGWQPHTCRAFLTGLRKKGRDIKRTRREDGATIYCMASMQAAA